MDYIYAELNDDIKDTYFTGYLSGSSNEEAIGVVVDVDNKTRQISADLSEATKKLLADHDAAIERIDGELDAEISRAENAEAELSQALTEEITRAEGVEEQLKSDLAEEEVARIEADNAIIERLDTAEEDINALEDRATAVEGRLNVIEGEGEGSVKKALQDAKDYVNGLFNTQDTRDDKQDNSIAANKAAIKREITDRKAAISSVVSSYETADLAINNKIGSVTDGKTVVDMIDEAQTAAEGYAKEYADDIVATEKTAREDEDSRLAGLIDDNTSAINKEIKDRAVAVKEVSDKVDVEKVSTAIATAKSEAIAAAKSETDGQVNALTEKVNKNTSDISDLDNTVSYEISRVEGLITTEATNRKSADDAINEHLSTIENTINSLETKDTELSAAIDTKLATDTFNTWKDSHETDHAKTATAITTEITTVVDNEKTLREAKDSELEGKISENTAAISNEVTARENAVNTINTKIGTVAEGKDVVTMINDAQAAAVTSANGYTDSKVSDLEEGQVKTNKEAIATLSDTVSSEIARVEGLVTAEETRAKDAEAGFESRIAEIEVFFKEEKVDDALNTLYEIQDYIDTHDGAVETMVGNINANATAIEGLSDRVDTTEGDIDALQEEFNTDTGRVKVAEGKITALEGRVTTVESRATTLEGKVATLEAKPFDTYATKTEVNAVSERAELGITNAEAAQSAADKAQSEVDVLEEDVGMLDARAGTIETQLGGNILGKAISVSQNYHQMGSGAESGFVGYVELDKIGLVEGKSYNIAYVYDGIPHVITRTGLNTMTSGNNIKVEGAISLGSGDASEIIMLDGTTQSVLMIVDGAKLDLSSGSVNFVPSDTESDTEAVICYIYVGEEPKNLIITRIFETDKGCATKEDLEAAQTAADNAQAAANTAQGEIDTLEGTVSTLRGEYNVTKALATANETAIGTLGTRVDTVEGKVSTLETESATHALKRDVETELAKKVNITEYETYQSTITEALNDRYTKTDIDGKFETLNDVVSGEQTKLEALTTRVSTTEGDIDTLKVASAKHAEKTYVDEELAKKVNNVAYTEKIAELTDSFSTHVHTLSIPSSATSTFTGEELPSTGTYTPQGNITVPELTITATPAEQSFLTSFTISLVPVDGDPDTVELVVSPVVAAVGAITASGSYAGEFSFTGTQGTVSVVGTPTGSVSTTLTTAEATTSTPKN